MTDEDRTECVRCLLAIQTEGGPRKIGTKLRKQATGLKLVDGAKARALYTLKANVLRGEMVLAGGDAWAEHPAQGAIADFLVGGHQLRGRITGQAAALVRLEHWHDGAWETVAVAPDKLREVNRKDL